MTVEWKHNHPGYSNCPRCVKRIRDLEAQVAKLEAWIAEVEELPPEQRIIKAMLMTEVQAYWVERAEKAEARIALMEQATCDFCGHAFYALEADG